MREIYKGQTTIKNIRRWIEEAIIPQYDFDSREASIAELVANSLDARASVIEINIKNEILEIADNGAGMNKKTFINYHDLTSKKKRGKGIGFVGQGTKIALTFCSKVVTQTQSETYKGYSEWQLIGDEAPFEIHHDKILDLKYQGTKVTLYLHHDNISFYNEKCIEKILEEHYYPLLDRKLVEVYSGKIPVLKDKRKELKQYLPLYPKGIKFFINGKEIIKSPLQDMARNRKEISITAYKSPKAQGFFGLVTNEISESLQGIAICTYGKVIQRTWFRKEPRDKEKIVGWIEAPYLIEAVTTDKCRFQRGNKKWEGFFRKAQIEFSRWLEEIGALEPPKRLEFGFSNIEKEINSILKNLPELSFFGDQVKRDVAITEETGETRELGEGVQNVPGTKGGKTEGKGGVSIFPGPEEGKAPTIELGAGPKAEVKPRTVRGGIKMFIEEKPDMEKEAHFDGEVVTINKSHPAYRRADKDGLLNYHILKAAGLSFVEFNLDKSPEPLWQEAFELQQKFFRLWGER